MTDQSHATFTSRRARLPAQIDKDQPGLDLPDDSDVPDPARPAEGDLE